MLEAIHECLFVRVSSSLFGNVSLSVSISASCIPKCIAWDHDNILHLIVEAYALAAETAYVFLFVLSN
ncbi:hypothetical protein Cob_v009350 [Colletotrichum orbiculare MAFF 240422]|uniref:Uncharacterized protein n=1 Tax=Colletotrichum orbiculare (strain 104-T / ATCC 96160 / CBS 514.97 / LARS 414 / MAFF 240422) TaxID=1213857 RepID=A0A484FHX7_COLOR|nr:hypothetical protein Cob_v009350 [Colletotrichum orbiculare MAFF 240422]